MKRSRRKQRLLAAVAGTSSFKLLAFWPERSMHVGPIHMPELTVLENGFELDARPYESLSEINWAVLAAA